MSESPSSDVSPPDEGNVGPAAPRWLIAALLAGPAAALLILLTNPLKATEPGQTAMAAVAAWMAIWWLTEAVPLAVTGILPLALFPILRIMSPVKVAASYGDKMLFLFLGGFLVALAIEESGLHRRLALSIVAAMGDNPRFIVLGFMLATALLSMWLSNTATTMMLLPIAVSVLSQAEQAGSDRAPQFGMALLLGVAYSASIGGVATPVGTPPNIFFRDYMERTLGAPQISFAAWMTLVLPISIIMLVGSWQLLVRVLFPLSSQSLLGGGQLIRRRLTELGPMRTAEWRTLIVFLTTAALWIFRQPVEGWGWAPALGFDPKEMDDSTVAIAMGVICFIVPSGEYGRPLLQWKSTVRVPWGILLLFGGGMALADGMMETGLAKSLADRLAIAAESMSRGGMVFVVTAAMTFLTEITSNLASVQMVLPVLSATGKQLGIDPLLLTLPATLAASWAFMLPAATPPNAIVYGSGKIPIRQMAKAGLFLNLIGIVIVVIAVMTVGQWVLGIEMQGLPDWAEQSK